MNKIKNQRNIHTYLSAAYQTSHNSLIPRPDRSPQKKIWKEENLNPNHR